MVAASVMIVLWLLLTFSRLIDHSRENGNHTESRDSNWSSTALTRKEVQTKQTWTWVDALVQDMIVFIEVKQLLTSTPMLHFPDFNKLLTAYVDTSKTCTGAIRAQRKDDNLPIIAYYGEWFSANECYFSATLLECLAVVLAILHWRFLYTIQHTSSTLTLWVTSL